MLLRGGATRERENRQVMHTILLLQDWGGISALILDPRNYEKQPTSAQSRRGHRRMKILVPPWRGLKPAETHAVTQGLAQTWPIEGAH